MNKYQSDICSDASSSLLKAITALKDVEFDLFNVEGGESLHTFYRVAQTMLNELKQGY